MKNNNHTNNIQIFTGIFKENMPWEGVTEYIDSRQLNIFSCGSICVNGDIEAKHIEATMYRNHIRVSDKYPSP